MSTSWILWAVPPFGLPFGPLFSVALRLTLRFFFKPGRLVMPKCNHGGPPCFPVTSFALFCLSSPNPLLTRGRNFAYCRERSSCCWGVLPTRFIFLLNPPPPSGTTLIFGLKHFVFAFCPTPVLYPLYLFPHFSFCPHCPLLTNFC